MTPQYIERNRGRLRWFDHYERFARIWKAALPNKCLREILPGDIERYIARRRADAPSNRKKSENNKPKPLAPATINRELAFLRRVFNPAIEDDKTDTNPVDLPQSWEDIGPLCEVERCEDLPVFQPLIHAELIADVATSELQELLVELLFQLALPLKRQIG